MRYIYSTIFEHDASIFIFDTQGSNPLVEKTDHTTTYKYIYFE